VNNINDNIYYMSFKDDGKNKILKLKEGGIEAYASDFPINYSVDKIIDLEENTFVKTAGRIKFCRHLGAISFLKIGNVFGNIQLFFDYKKFKYIINNEDAFKYINLGDIVGVEGKIIFTSTGEKSIEVEKITLLSKCLEQISDKWHGVTDTETKLRKRYVDLIANEESRNIFHRRHKLLKNIREYLYEREFTEVETPILQNIPSGASAYPFKTHYEALNDDFFLRIAPELFLKRLLVGGYEKIFEIGKCFRNEGIDRSHLQEFTMMECYISYMSYKDLQKFVVDFLQTIILKTIGTLKTSYIDFSEVEYISYDDLFIKYGGIDIRNKTYEDLKEIAKREGIKIELFKSFDALKDAIYKKLCLSKIINPVLVYDYPSTPLSYPNLEKPGYNYQFQLIVGHFEIVRACIELIDSEIQNKNFNDQMKLNLESGEKEVVRKDEDFIEALETGMAPTGGFGLGIDRLMMLISGENTSIRDVVLFPATKVKNK
jgi:lysyl-tRNA synthetase class 2